MNKSKKQTERSKHMGGGEGGPPNTSKQTNKQKSGDDEVMLNVLRCQLTY